MFHAFTWDIHMCERNPCRVTSRGVIHEVIYQWDVRVDAQQNGLWVATLTEYGPLCKGECTEGDWCSAWRLRGSSVRCMMWWKWVNVFLYHFRSLATLHAGYCLWIIDYLGKGILIITITILHFFLNHCFCTWSTHLFTCTCVLCTWWSLRL